MGPDPAADPPESGQHMETVVTHVLLQNLLTRVGRDGDVGGGGRGAKPPIFSKGFKQKYQFLIM